MLAQAFKAQVATWLRRAHRLGAAGVGRIGEDHVQQGHRIERGLDAFGKFVSAL